MDLQAISKLSAYRWPGNIRQLKNVAETITAIESKPLRGSEDRVELGVDVLSRYLPDEQDSLLPAMPAASKSSAGPFADADKHMIINALLDLKREVDALKLRVDSADLSAVPEAHHGYIAPPTAPDEPEEQIPSFEESEPAEISIRQMGDDLIERALARHGGKVKPAAKELGISERTIYRKLAVKKKKQ